MRIYAHIHVNLLYKNLVGPRGSGEWVGTKMVQDWPYSRKLKWTV